MLVEFDDLVVAQVGLEGRVDDIAVLVDGAIGRHGLVRRRLFEFERRRKGGLDGTGKLNVFRVGSLRERAGKAGGGRWRKEGRVGPSRQSSRTRPPEGGRQRGQAKLHHGSSVGPVGEGQASMGKSNMMTVEKRHEVVVKPPCDGRAEGDVMLNRHKPKSPTLEGRGRSDETGPCLVWQSRVA